jgi:hypothetical protein
MSEQRDKPDNYQVGDEYFGDSISEDTEYNETTEHKDVILYPEFDHLVSF